MTSNQPLFVSFKPEGNTYTAYIPLDQFLASDKDVETILGQLAKTYHNSITSMRNTLAEIDNFRSIRKPLPARLVWQLGDNVFQLVNELGKLSLQIDGIYDHLERDLNVKRKWLEKVIIFRRYISEKRMIPEHLNWGKCEKGTRRVAELIQKGIPPH